MKILKISQFARLIFINLKKYVAKFFFVCYNIKCLKKALSYAFIAQLDRALVYGTKGRGLESLWTHQNIGKTCRFFYV